MHYYSCYEVYHSSSIWLLMVLTRLHALLELLCSSIWLLTMSLTLLHKLLGLSFYQLIINDCNITACTIKATPLGLSVQGLIIIDDDKVTTLHYCNHTIRSDCSSICLLVRIKMWTAVLVYCCRFIHPSLLITPCTGYINYNQIMLLQTCPACATTFTSIPNGQLGQWPSRQQGCPASPTCARLLTRGDPNTTALTRARCVPSTCSSRTRCCVGWTLPRRGAAPQGPMGSEGGAQGWGVHCPMVRVPEPL